MTAALTLSGIERRFRQGDAVLEILRGVSVSVAAGEMLALLGPSGAGKSTLLQIAGLLEPPDAGQVAIAGQDASTLGDRDRTRLRRERLGFVYQFHHLLPEFSALENVCLPQRIAGRSAAGAKERATALLSAVGLAERLEHRPARLSGGEQQRVAIARALANEPVLLIADEPTGNLDEETAQDVFAMLTQLARDQGVAALIATHNRALAGRMDRVLMLREGQVQKVTDPS